MKNPWKISTLVLAAALGVVVGTGRVPRADAEQPQMQEALAKLREVKSHLEHASHDHGGHREKALEATKQAIAEVQLGIAWAAEHK
jgi:hypothetical protein